MKKLFFAFALMCSFAANAQYFWVKGKDTMPGPAFGKPVYYQMAQLDVAAPLYKINPHTIGVSATFIGVDSLTTFKYKQTNQTKTLGIGIMDSIITNGIQFSPSLLYQGVDSVLGGIKKKIGMETYLEPILNTSAVYPSMRMRWFWDTTVNSSTGVGTGYSAMELYHNAGKSTNGTSVNLDFPNGATLTGYSNIAVGNTYGMRLNNGNIDFLMGSSVPLTISNSLLAIPSGSVVGFNSLSYLHYLSGNTIGVGVSSLDFNSGGLAAQLLSLGAAPTIGAGKQFSVYGSQGTYGSVNSAFQGAPAINGNSSISYTSGSSNVTGSGGFLSMLNAGDSIIFNIGQAGGTQKAKISSITDDTHLVLTANVTVTATASYSWYDLTLYQQPFFTVQYNGQVAIGTATPNASAIVDITSTTKGLLLPRMTTAQRNAISSPAEGLKIYNNDLHADDYYNGTTWITSSTIPQALTDGATVTMDCSLGYNGYFTLTGDHTLALSNLSAGKEIYIEITQDGTGSRHITLPSTSKVPNGFGSGTSPTLSTGAGKTDAIIGRQINGHITWSVLYDVQ